MREVAHFGTGFGKEVEVFWTSFLGAGLGAVGTIWEEIGGDEEEHVVDETFLFAGGSRRGMDDIGEVASGVQRAFEADFLKTDEMKV